MKKNLLSVLCAMTLIFGMSSVFLMNAEASEAISYDHSSLTQNTESVSGPIYSTRGMYLQSGATAVVKKGKGLLVAFGDTVGQQYVDTIKVAVIVEQWNAVDKYWSQCYSWEANDINCLSISSTRTLNVPRGYYYRVRGIHSANSDRGYSYTDGIWFG